ncbi:phospholipid-transporting ATPase 1-like [Lycium ferocissimum]|uniref:phospholipid-transporting ATPase 1-like n=1 Tax=Lycium ferocissimum TaxID=112874 RepID=UPI002815FDB1|nr:phospholipid-transporting ATPase 1-like [Lycium ferocissimum]XP_059296743.1 phospholipid-transporting ATPase 1-like [Lycium ferocissimum]
MTSGKPLLSSAEPSSAPSPNHHNNSSLGICSLGCLPQNVSGSGDLDELPGTNLRDLKEEVEKGNQPLEDTNGTVELQSFSSKNTSRERKRFVSWGGTEDQPHEQTTFEISSDSSRVASSRAASTRTSSQRHFDESRSSSRGQDKLNKSQRLLQKSMQLDNDLLHGSNARLIHVNDPRKTNDQFEFTGNEIRTSRYTIINFLPKNLFIQFHRVAYLYFLAIAALNQLPPLAVFGRTVSLFPLLFVLSVTAIKDGYEDWRRHRSDRNENNREALVLQFGKFQLKRWKNIRVGEVVKILADETIPCDMVLLRTSDPSGIAYIQTMNLDGESNLKTRYARQETTSLANEVETLLGVIRCEQPNRNIYEFTANMELNGHKFPLSQSNIILRGCQLKNTEWALGVAVYAGQETKAMLNSAASPSKRSRLETYMNRETLWLSVFLFVMCLVVAIGMCLWLKEHEKQLDTLPYYRKIYSEKGTHPGKPYRFYGIPMETFFSFLSSVIVFQIMIPISLYITMELVRLGQSYFMIGDRHMYDDNSNSRFQCRSLNINEDLGQIRYIFSDKTGTLTENKMEFKRASVWGKNYGSLSAAGASSNTDFGEPTAAPSSGRKLRLNSEIPTDSELMELLHIELAGEERIAAHEFFMTLAACNTVIPIVTHSSSSCAALDEVHDTVGTIEYQGESPDEQALVAAASAYGYTLCERTSGHIVIDVNGEKLRLDVLGLHEFDSVRKRMSVVIRFPSGAVKVLVKGADTTMFSILRKDHKSHDDIQNATLNHLNEYSSEGLRTLVVAARDLTGEELEEWQIMYENASTSLTDRSAKLRQTASLIECNLTLLGASAIEDKLQEGVPEAIESLRQAGMKVWVLTGDKQETAISIGMSCKLLTSDMQRIIINGTSENECKRLLFDAKVKFRVNPASCNQISTCQSDAENGYHGVPASMKSSNLPEPHAREEGVSDGPLALIIDGNSLVYILEKDLETDLFDLATSCRVVICCRVAPLQKAGIVDLIKSRTDDMTLAIGDGANDVSMIQMADVGVGICGQEGRQAVMASDFAMGQFRFLKRLLLVHGHWNYQRVGYLVLYNFYRNAVFVFMLFWYILYAAFSTTSALTDWSSVFYSLIYTSIPTLVVGILDKDLSYKTLLKYPKLYAAGYRHESYNMKLFWITMLDTVWQSLVLFYVPVYIYDQSDIDIWSMGSLWTIAVAILVNMHLAMDVQRWLIFTHMAIWGSIIITYGCLVVLDLIPVFPNYNTIFQLAKSPTYWLSILLIIVLALLPRFIVKVINQSFRPSDIQIAREAEITKKSHSYFMSKTDHDTS